MTWVGTAQNRHNSVLLCCVRLQWAHVVFPDNPTVSLFISLCEAVWVL